MREENSGSELSLGKNISDMHETQFVNVNVLLFSFGVWSDNFIFDHLVLNKSSGS